ncbi:hypothetical protein AB6A40_009343 [Gnathostoma spinigerum]|uniref:Uncharacterized protein n=1 Tax=Gnathostoma spinigerum TaxID=75299 RepID=A0ABD6ERQ1_9BILA
MFRKHSGSCGEKSSSCELDAFIASQRCHSETIIYGPQKQEFPTKFTFNLRRNVSTVTLSVILGWSHNSGAVPFEKHEVSFI